MLGFLAGPVRDVSVSRPRARVHDWGIPVPGDPDQIVYVWFDALTNYMSALGYGGADAALLSRVVVRVARTDARDRQGHRAVPRA